MRLRHAAPALLLSASALAQPTAFTYQGKLTDGGNPAHGEYQLELKLYDAPDVGTGNQVGGSLSGVTISPVGGLFTLQLDFGANAFDGSERYLQVGVRPNGSGSPYTVLSPRQRVTSAPYAIDSARLGGLPAASFIPATDTHLLKDPGTANLFGGYQAGQSNTGTQNTFLGYDAGQANTTGSQNTFYGDEAGYGNTTGSHNTFVGYRAGEVNSTEGDNSFFGFNAGYANLGGVENAFFGADAGWGNRGSQNCYFGRSAGYAPFSTSSQNAFFGFEAGKATTGGGGDVFIGYRSGVANTSGLSDTFVGSYSGITNSSGIQNTFVGTEAGYYNSTGNANTFIGWFAGSPSGTQVSFSAAIGNGAIVNTDHTIVLGTSAEKTSIPGALAVSGLVTLSSLGSAGSTALCRNASGQVATCSSSLRYKKDVEAFTPGLAIAGRLRPISYTWKDGGARDLGLAAEDVAAVEPLLVTSDATGRVEGVKYDRVVVVLLNAVNEQQREIEALRAELARLRTATPR